MGTVGALAGLAGSNKRPLARRLVPGGVATSLCGGGNAGDFS